MTEEDRNQPNPDWVTSEPVMFILDPKTGKFVKHRIKHNPVFDKAPLRMLVRDYTAIKVGNPPSTLSDQNT